MFCDNANAYARLFFVAFALLALSGIYAAAPSFSLYAPADLYNTTSITNNFNFSYASDNPGATIMSCGIYYSSNNSLAAALNASTVNNTATVISVTMPANAAYGWYVGCTGADSGNSANRTITIDMLPPNVTGNYTDADPFYSPFAGNNVINIGINATDSLTTVSSVKANFSNISSACGTGGIVSLAFNATSGLWEGSCDASVALAALPAPTYPSDSVIYINATDALGNNNTAYQIHVLPHNMGVQGPNNTCTRSGASTTNMTRVLNFSSVNFIQDVEINMSCFSPLSGWMKGALLNFTSINMNDANIGTKMQALATAINVSIAPARTFTQSYISVDPTSFAELSSSTTITLYNLPFMSMPTITASNASRQAGIAVITNPWAYYYNSTFNASVGNLTFNVTGFSSYNISDSVAPSISMLQPAAGYSANTTAVTINVSANGTGSEISYLNISITNSTGSLVNSTVYTNTTNTSNCYQISAGSENVTCQIISPVPADGVYTITVTARDYGNGSGNTGTAARNITIDRAPPTVTPVFPVNAYNFSSGSFSLVVNATDAVATALNCSLYVNGIFNQSNVSAIAGANTSFALVSADGYYNWTVSCKDSQNNTGTFAVRNYTVDTTAPAITVNSPAPVANVTNATVVFNFTVADAVSATTNCTLYINTAPNSTNATVVNNTAANWTIAMANGTYGWNITCFDAAPFNAQSSSSTGSLVVGILGNNTILNTTTNVTSNGSVIVTSSSPAANITMGSSSTNVTLDVSSVYNGTSFNATIANAITANASTTLGNVIVQFPAGETITGASDWSGTLSLPSITASYTSPTNAGTNTVYGAVELGLTTMQLNFSNAVRILIPGASGKLAGFSRGGTFTQITNTCTTDSQAWADANVAAGSECMKSVGSDLVIWTKHFTQFITYTNTPPSSGTSGGSSNNGGGSVSGGGSATPTKTSTEYPVDVGLGKFCTVGVSREITSTDNLSVLTTTIENMGGADCSMTDFVFADVIPANFSAMTDIAFSPAYVSREGWMVTFSFPSFAGGESKVLTYSVNGWVMPSKANYFTNVAVAAKKQVAAPPQNQTQPAQPPKVTQPPAQPPAQPAKQPSAPAQQPAAAPTPAPPAAKQSDWLGSALGIGAVLVAILVVAGVAFYFVKGRKKRGL